MTKKSSTYADSGVDIQKEGEAIDEIWELLPKTFNLNPHAKFLPALSHYGGIIDIGLDDKYLAVTVDGVGSKVLVAQMLNKFDTVGIDCVAMNVNDLICMGAEPIAFVDYYAIQEPDSKMAHEITQGLVEGAIQSKMAIIGGETATLPDIIKGLNKKGFDLAGVAIGLLPKEQLILGEEIKPGDKIFGIASDGLHSNGFTLARKVLLENHSIHDTVDGVSLADELIRPTAIYVQEVLEMVKRAEIHGLANITGGAFLKLARLLRQAKTSVGVKLDSLPEPQPIFQLIRRLGNVTTKEMYKTFNMGVGFCVIAPESEAAEIEAICTHHRKDVQIIGEITGKPEIILELASETLEYPADKY